MRVGLRGLGRGRPRKVTGVPQPPGPTPVSFLQETVLAGSPNRGSVGLRTRSLPGCSSSPAVHLGAKRPDLRNPKSVCQL